MKPNSTLAAILIASSLVLCATAQAATDVRVGINLGLPGVYVEPAPVYYPPPPVYVEPRRVYVQPQPVYVQPQPVYVQQRPVMVQPVYFDAYGQSGQDHEYGYNRHDRHDKWKHGRGHDRDRDGVPDYADRDRDGDGVPNQFDRRPDDNHRR
jgi:hypothetical protein